MTRSDRASLRAGPGAWRMNHLLHLSVMLHLWTLRYSTLRAAPLIAAQVAVLATLMSIIAPSGHAGVFEVSASGSYRKQTIEIDAYDESRSLTGSIAYYLSEATAIEASYTSGTSRRAISEDLANGHVTSLSYTTTGLDVIYTAGGKESAIRPYVKAGAAYILSKKIVDQYRAPDGTLMPATTLEDSPGAVPSAGLGIRLSLTSNLSLKVGVDGWTSRPMSKPPVTIDWFGRAGLSLFF